VVYAPILLGRYGQFVFSTHKTTHNSLPSHNDAAMPSFAQIWFRGSTLEGFNQFLADYRIGDYAGIFGLLVSVVGFILTVRASVSSKNAAVQTRSVVESMRNDLRRVDTVSDFSTAVAIMEEIKRLHRLNSLQLLPERYSQLTKFLINIRSSNPLLSGEDQKLVQGAITQFSALERLVEGCLHDSVEKIDMPTMNALVSKQMEAVQGLLIRIKVQIGGVSE